MAKGASLGPQCELRIAPKVSNLRGSVHTVVAGTQYTSLNNKAGEAWAFSRDGTSWNQEAYLTPSDGFVNDRFGESIAILGDTMVVGAKGAYDQGSRSGAAYVFQRIGGTWVEQAKLTASAGMTYDHFGWSVAMDEGTIVVGANRGWRTGLGSAYVFVRSGGLWTEEVALTASDGANFDWFGDSVAVAGDTVVVGAPGSSSAYVFVRNGASWSEEAKLVPAGGPLDISFGESVAASGDMLVVGAPGDDELGQQFPL